MVVSARGSSCFFCTFWAKKHSEGDPLIMPDFRIMSGVW